MSDARDHPLGLAEQLLLVLRAPRAVQPRGADMSNLQQVLDTVKEDRAVVEPFVRLLHQRMRELHPGQDIRLEDISFTVELRLLNASAQVHRMLGDMLAEGVSV